MQVCKPQLRCIRLVLTRPQRYCYAESLAASSLASFQGPALLACNDGKVFSEQDYASISSLGNSVKKDQKGKTGRFGVGFNAAYHLTDLPSFVSGELTGLSMPHGFMPAQACRGLVTLLRVGLAAMSVPPHSPGQAHQTPVTRCLQAIHTPKLIRQVTPYVSPSAALHLQGTLWSYSTPTAAGCPTSPHPTQASASTLSPRLRPRSIQTSSPRTGCLAAMPRLPSRAPCSAFPCARRRTRKPAGSPNRYSPLTTALPLPPLLHPAETPLLLQGPPQCQHSLGQQFRFG